jgi:hypothetical protein
MAATSSHSSASGPLTLIQLAGDNVLANLLPIMALRPSRVIQVRSRGDRHELAVSHFRASLQVLGKEPAFAGLAPKVSDHVIQSEFPDLAETRDFLAALLLQNPGAVVNLSGGSKLMSMGAYQAAVALGRASIYTDLEGHRFVNGRTGPLSHPPEFKKLVDQLGLQVLLMTMGRNFGEWRHEVAGDALKAFALRSYELRAQHWSALEAFAKALRMHFFGALDRLPGTEAELNALLAKPLPPTCLSSEPARTLLAAAVTAGLAKAHTQDSIRLACKATRRSIEQHINWLTNDWLELAVLDRVQRLPHIKQVHWGLSAVQSGEGDAPGYGILCLDSQVGSIRYIECCATLTGAPQDHLERTLARAQQLAGNAVHAMLVVFRTGQDQVLKQNGRRLGVEVVVGPEEIVKVFTQRNSVVVK